MNFDKVFVDGVNQNKVSFYKTAKAILKNEDDIEDAIQDTLESAYKSIQTLKEPKYFKTWMTRILINKCYDILRKKAKVIPLDSEVLENKEDPRLFNEQVELQMILDKLSQDLKDIVILFYYNDFKQDEIAKILDIPKETVKSRLHRARNEIISLIECKKGVI